MILQVFFHSMALNPSTLKTISSISIRWMVQGGLHPPAGYKWSCNPLLKLPCKLVTGAITPPRTGIRGPPCRCGKVCFLHFATSCHHAPKSPMPNKTLGLRSNKNLQTIQFKEPKDSQSQGFGKKNVILFFG